MFKCSFNLGIFQTGSDPSPRNFGTFGALFRRLFCSKSFWALFCHISVKSWGKSSQKLLDMVNPPPPFSTQNFRYPSERPPLPRL